MEKKTSIVDFSIEFYCSSTKNFLLSCNCSYASDFSINSCSNQLVHSLQLKDETPTLL